jgi:tetratricopeptide (TPR) repeat protein
MNKKAFTRILLAVATGALLSACYPAYYFEMEGLEPAKFEINPGVRSLTMAARHDLDLSLRTGQFSGPSRALFIRDSTEAKESYNGCWDALLETPRFQMQNPSIRRTLSGEYTDPAKPLPWPVIREVAGVPAADGVLVLEACAMKDTLIPAVRGGWLGVYEYRLITTTYWRLYSLPDFKHQEFLFTDTLKSDISPEDAGYGSPVVNSLRLRGNYLAGERSGRKLAPYWSDLDRLYFPYGQGGFYQGAAYMRQGDWQKAAAIWEVLAESRSKIQAAKASYNMAIACEMAGRTDLAMTWLAKAESLGMPEYLVTDYSRKLKSRLIKEVELDKQMGVITNN